MKSTAVSSRALFLGALGVVFGDIGTSPLYTLRECLRAAGGFTPEALLGILSLIAWSLTLVVTFKYVLFVMRADNEGEGGILALTALAVDKLPACSKKIALLLGLLGAAMFYGDSMVTPAISVLSAVEGLKVFSPGLSELVLPLTLVILGGLFAAQRKGTQRIGKLFGPAMALWFSTLALTGVWHLVQRPGVLRALWPGYAWHYALAAPGTTFVVLSAVFLAVTGGEALYADMGHFGKAPIQRAWLWAVFPALLLNYFGQGAMLLGDPGAAKDPFFLLVPHALSVVLTLMACVATVIASQAVISGAFSMTRQAVSLGYLPRLAVLHTSSQEIGQVYVPLVNNFLLVAVVALVLGFKSSDNLAAAYGIAVASTMLLTTAFMAAVARYVWSWSWLKTLVVVLPIAVVDACFMAGNADKVVDGGWFPLAAGVGLFTLMTTWKRGREVMFARMRSQELPLQAFVEQLFAGEDKPMRATGTAVFMTSVCGVAPASLLHNLKHNQVLHEVNIVMTFKTLRVPYVRNDQRLSVQDLGHRFYAVEVRVGFKETANVPKMLTLLASQLSPWTFEAASTSFFLNRETVVASPSIHSMAHWRERLFVLLQRNATKAADYFQLPSERVIELGCQVTI